MNLTFRDVDGTRVVSVGESRIDAAGAIQFKDSMKDMTEEGPARVVLDLSAVDFLDSSGLGAVVAAMKQAGPSKKLELAGLTPTVQKVFKLTRMDGVFVIHSSVEAALERLADAS